MTSPRDPERNVPKREKTVAEQSRQGPNPAAGEDTPTGPHSIRDARRTLANSRIRPGEEPSSDNARAKARSAAEDDATDKPTEGG